MTGSGGSEGSADSKRLGVLRRIIPYNLGVSDLSPYQKLQDTTQVVVRQSDMSPKSQPRAPYLILRSSRNFTVSTAQPEPWEADLTNFLCACETLGKDNQGRKAQEFVDRLDEVCHPDTTKLDSLTAHLGSR